MDYKEINLDNYRRKEHFNHFKSWNNPFISVTIKIDITKWFYSLKNTKYPFFLSFLYAVVKAANRVDEFKQRIVDDKIIQYDYCNPSYTIALSDNTFRYCLVNSNLPFNDYLLQAKQREEEFSNKELTESDTLGLLFISCTPFLNFESVNLAFPSNKNSNPNIVWGKYNIEKEFYIENGKQISKQKYTIPLSITVNHALVDAIHISEFISCLKEELENMINNEFNI